MKVQDLMSHPAITCDVNDGLHVPAKLMWDHDCGVIAVVRDDGKLAGVITDRDICMAAYFQGRPLSAIPVADIMSRDLCTVEAEAELSEAERLMQARQVRRLPVVGNGGRLIGILSLSDVARGVPRSTGRPGAPESQELLRTVEKVSEPRR